MMNIKLGKLKPNRFFSIENVAFYLFTYHIIISGIFRYNELIGNFPTIPYKTPILFGIPLILYTIVSCCRMFIHKHDRKVLFRNVLFMAIMGYMTTVVIWNGRQWGFTHDVSVYNLMVIVWYFIAFMIGSNLEVTPSYRNIALAGYLVLLVNVFANTNFDTGRIVMTYDELGALHFLGDGFAIWSLLVIALSKNKLMTVIIIPVSIICLYLISSRTSLYAFVCVLPFVVARNKNGIVKFLVVGCFFIIIGAVIIYFEQLVSSRMLKFIFTGDDHSFYLRKVIMSQNMIDLKENWLFGDYAGQLDHGVFGYYIHNYLSLWRQFGLFPFLAFVVLLFPFFGWVFSWMTGRKFQDQDFLFYLVIFSLVEIVFTRAYKFHFIWIALGIITLLIKIVVKERKKKPDPIPGINQL
jgi:hypothetical protein